MKVLAHYGKCKKASGEGHAIYFSVSPWSAKKDDTELLPRRVEDSKSKLPIIGVLVIAGAVYRIIIAKKEN